MEGFLEIRFNFSLHLWIVRLESLGFFFGIKTNKKRTIKNYKPLKGIKILTEIPEKHYTISSKTFSKFSS